ncbi:asparagine synthase (glutamine-hydrolyzing) [Polynucleobacter difficilis]|uniref:asparagine synthase (glutamine-hydrolyzing) n=1 Tax=Polynucleobacter difficilis TaxID=556054 RepID=UPI000D335657|nr:asparagine synthase (glutamine-hydrolyzing) [Polynucleobacter difficilis]
MCGIAGFIDQQSGFNSQGALSRMAGSISHRGPDDSGVWHDNRFGVGLAHTRLSILDLSVEGNQPMISISGRYTLVFNGEIYNHLEVRELLSSRDNSIEILRWRGHSDTETLLAAFEAWGINKTLQKSVGMFAFAVWDNLKRTITLGRDRMGEKPLYYGWQDGIFLFGSELKALRAHPRFENRINRNAIALQLKYNYIPAPYSIYLGVHKLMPGTTLTISHSASPASGFELTPYWSLNESHSKSFDSKYYGRDIDGISQLHSLCLESIKQQMVADVPLGAFLSGGIDSSAVVAMMQAQSVRPISTFTIGFSESIYDEANYAREVAKHLGTNHTELYVTPQHALDVIPKLPSLYDEPFSDSSQIPTYLVSMLAQQHVKVSLSGDGGDELFGGYNRYLFTTSIWKKISYYPPRLRKACARLICKIPPHRWNIIFNSIDHLLFSRFQFNNPGDKLHKLSGILGASSVKEIYLSLISHWEDSLDIVLGSEDVPTIFNDPNGWSITELAENKMMFLDMVSYLPDDILVKVDRAAMGVGLETRVPLLDHRIVEFSQSIPLSMKIRNRQGKWLLRKVLDLYVPSNLIDRPKMGFGVPIGEWLRGPLKHWAEDLLSESRLKKEGYLAPVPIRKKWAEHLSGKRNWQYHLWDVLMFQAWVAENNV